MVKRDSFDRLILAVIFRIGAHARGILSFDLVFDPDPSTMLRVMVRYSNHEVLDRWYGVNPKLEIFVVFALSDI